MEYTFVMYFRHYTSYNGIYHLDDIASWLSISDNFGIIGNNWE